MPGYRGGASQAVHHSAHLHRMVSHQVAVQNQRRQQAARVQTVAEKYVPEFPVLVSQTVIIPFRKTAEGQLIRSAMFPLLAIIERIMNDPSLIYEVDPPQVGRDHCGKLRCVGALR
jgi:hypothetical protein